MNRTIKTFTKILLILFGIIIGSVITFIFLISYGAVGIEQESWVDNTLFSILRNIDYNILFQVFIYVSIYMLLMDSLFVAVKNAIRSSSKKDSNSTNFLSKLINYWHVNRKIHLTFLLLTLFLTIGITAPINIINIFTAMVSVSILISNLTKKVPSRKSNNQS